jgi:hypothetical protein
MTVILSFLLLFSFFSLTECPAEEGKYPVPQQCVSDYYECIAGYPQKLVVLLYLLSRLNFISYPSLFAECRRAPTTTSLTPSLMNAYLPVKLHAVINPLLRLIHK